ncbi:hypothetical protein [Dactylosporangium sp. NPDC051484]|uniref:hypothetical protein n=1 Tax=Dactylosporangium sp. NPDC051484 TaxID=3154942 RepID=UPI00344C687D
MNEVRVVFDPLEARLLPAEPGRAVRVALAVPTSGTLGMLAPAVLNCASPAKRGEVREGDGEGFEG